MLTNKKGAKVIYLRSEQFINEFIRAGGTLSHERGEIHVRFGRVDSARETVTLPMPGKESYRANALKHVRDTYGITKDFSAKQDAEEFFAPTAKR